MPIAQLGVVVLDCPRPRELAEFYAAVLGGSITGDEGGWVDVAAPGGHRLAFQKAPGYVAPSWPAPDASQQYHLDLTAEDLDAAEKEILALGATVLDAEDRDRSWRVYADPAGHPFRLCAC
ncbi:VOC family protein [Streptomyces sp. NBC_00006]|uniref:VOC family protein n=1 Tax=Streptomyces sp. NBC_00006 TaxID=2975619 RepID=UPI00225B5E77|nr:VOC family protein [Streptomyces sp. NBC_00006]MCX5533150.1 VOC family protein [Streptomyces sp. NBC_00006]